MVEDSGTQIKLNIRLVPVGLRFKYRKKPAGLPVPTRSDWLE